jgi:hypothetical protein
MHQSFLSLRATRAHAGSTLRPSVGSGTQPAIQLARLGCALCLALSFASGLLQGEQSVGKPKIQAEFDFRILTGILALWLWRSESGVGFDAWEGSRS